jgi:hypothetical protein
MLAFVLPFQPLHVGDFSLLLSEAISYGTERVYNFANACVTEQIDKTCGKTCTFGGQNSNHYMKSETQYYKS